MICMPPRDVTCGLISTTGMQVDGEKSASGEMDSAPLAGIRPRGAKQKPPAVQYQGRTPR